MTTPSFYFSSETTVEATTDKKTKNQTGQYGKSPNVFVTYATSFF